MLHDDIKSGHRLIGDQQAGLKRQSHGDDSALFHAAGEFMRVVHQAFSIQADQVKKVSRVAPRRPFIVAAADP